MTPKPSSAWGSSQTLLTTPGTVFGCACTIASAGAYYLLFLDATSAPNDGTDVTGGAAGAYLHAVPVTTTIDNQTVDVDLGVGGGIVSQSGIRCSTGCTVLLSSTGPTSTTKVASGLWCNGRVS